MAGAHLPHTHSGRWCAQAKCVPTSRHLGKAEPHQTGGDRGASARDEKPLKGFGGHRAAHRARPAEPLRHRTLPFCMIRPASSAATPTQRLREPKAPGAHPRTQASRLILEWPLIPRPLLEASQAGTCAQISQTLHAALEPSLGGPTRS